MERAEHLLSDEAIDCMVVLKEHADKTNCECDGLWLRLALDLLDKNDIDPHVFSEALRVAFAKGREKHVNVIIIGPADSAKTFILQPITKAIPNTFQNPAKGMFGWLGVDKANAVFLNDLRWIAPNVSGFFIAWDDFLKLLEGKQVTLPAPMNSSSKHIHVSRKMPIFATSIGEVRYHVRNVDEPQTNTHLEENTMMESRWNVIRFKHRFHKSDKIDVPECCTCFSKLVLGDYGPMNTSMTI